MKVNNVNDTIKNSKIRNNIFNSNKNDTNFESLINSGPELTNNQPVFNSPSANLYIQNLFIDQQQKEEKKLAKKKITEMISLLEKLRDGIIEENISLDDLQNLEHLVSKSSDNFDDHQLQQILSEVELRAAVEVSKLKKQG